MSAEKISITPAVHRQLAVDLFNATWTLLDKSGRSAGDDELMVHTAHASAYPWRQVGEPLLLPQGHNGLGFGIQGDIVAPLVPVAYCLAQPGDPLGLGVAVRVTALRTLHQFVDNMCRRGLVRIAHAEIDDVLPRCPGLVFQVTDNVENVGGKTRNAPKLLVHD